WLNTEQTIYIRINSDGSASSIQLRSRSNHQGVQYHPFHDVGYLPRPDGGREISNCGFGNYLVKWGEKQLNFVSVELEIMHPLYRRDLLVIPSTIPKERYIGFKTVTRTVLNRYVKLEGYNNLDVSSQSNW